MFKIGQEVNQYGMTGIVVEVFDYTKKVVLHFEETDEDIEFDFDELEED